MLRFDRTLAMLLQHLGRHHLPLSSSLSVTHTHTRTHSDTHITWILSYGCLSCSNYMMCGNCQSLKRALQTHFKGSGARPRTQLTRSTEPRWAGGPRAPLPIVLIFTLISEYAVGGVWGDGLDTCGKAGCAVCSLGRKSDTAELTLEAQGHRC